jgi:hypothetical protein
MQPLQNIPRQPTIPHRSGDHAPRRQPIPHSRSHDAMGERPGSERSFRHHLANAGWFLCGLGFGFTALTFALGAVPGADQLIGGAQEETPSEIRVKKIREIDFDRDIAELSVLEGRYARQLTKGRVARPSPVPVTSSNQRLQQAQRRQQARIQQLKSIR